MKNWQK